MYTISINQETMDNIFRAVLVEDYRGLCQDIENLDAVKGTLPSYQLEDLVAFKKYKNAMEVLFNYYLTEFDRDKVMAGG